MKNKLLNLLIITLMTFSTAAAAADFTLKVGDVVPANLGKDTNGEEVNVPDLAGKIVVISFWASWCAPCLKELPILENIQNHLGKDRVEVIAVNYKEDSRRFKQVKKKLAALNLTLTRDRRGSIGKRYGVKGIPHLFVLDKQGKLAFQQRGYSEETVKKIVEILNQELTG
ncbi:MAG: TlpA family protein disulfide reductase [Gammaproteobacteria bacterium]|nr:TlpA family protein disulfide reductase [Gammaproteobacteria bacterium]